MKLLSFIIFCVVVLATAHRCNRSQEQIRRYCTRLNQTALSGTQCDPSSATYNATAYSIALPGCT